MMVNLDEFRNHVLQCANTGELVVLPDSIDKLDAGSIMAEVAASFVDQGQGIKAIIVLEERKRLQV